jgi:hypothetical protein
MATKTSNKSKGGRPTLINQKLDNGRTISQQIIELLRCGNYFEQACMATGVGRRTPYDWLREGAKTSRLLAADPKTKLTRAQKDCYQFWKGCMQAQAEWETRSLELLEAVAMGGAEIDGRIIGPVKITKVRKDGPFGPSTEVKTEFLPPDPKVLMWRLERMYPERYGRKIEIRGETSLADPLTRDDRFDVLSSKLEAYLEGVDDGRAQNDEPVEI